MASSESHADPVADELAPTMPVEDVCDKATDGELSPAELGAWRGFLRVHAALAKVLDAELAAEHDLPLSSYEVLITLQAAPGRRCRMAELADRVLLSRSGTTRLVDRLAREGLLERDTCTDDGRGTYAVLTDAGAALLDRARPTHLEDVRERFLRHFSEDELATLASWWERVLPGAAGRGPQDLSP
jgi:DNA-binding MarR family transcriptional regulator